MSAPTYFGSASVPADNSTNATTQLTVTPPGSMTTGDLVVVVCMSRPSATWSVGVTGGQAWTGETAFAGSATNFCRIFWATYNGTWAANPRFDSTVGTVTSAVMHVFRPDATTKAWGLDVAQASTAYAAPSSPFTVTRTGLTNVNADTVTLATFASSDDNTWGSMTGTGWVLTGSAQYRNTSGTQMSVSFAHHLDAPAGSIVPSVGKNQSALGGDAGVTAIISFYAFATVSGFAVDFRDDFTRADADSLGSNWSETRGDLDIASNGLVAGTGGGIYNIGIWTANTLGAIQYVRANVTGGGTGGNRYLNMHLRYTDDSTTHYILEFNIGTGAVFWASMSGNGSDYAVIQSAGTLSSWTALNQHLGATIEGTGTSTVIRIWGNCTGLPVSASNWNGDTTPDMTLTSDPATAADTGNKVGISLWWDGSASPVVDDFFGGGDSPAGAPSGFDWGYYFQQMAA